MDMSNPPEDERAAQGGAMNKTVEYYMGLPYSIELWRAPEGGWLVRVKELPGCVSQGETAEEALAMIQDAMQGWLEVALAIGDPIPQPRPEEDYSGKFVVRVPRSLHRELVNQADREGVSLNQYINVMLGKAVGRAGTQRKEASTEASVTAWPGLSKAARAALQLAGLGAEAGRADEDLVGDWMSRLLNQIERAQAQGNSQAAIDSLDYLTSILRNGAQGNRMIEAVGQAIRLSRRVIEDSSDTQRALLRDPLLRGQLAQLLRDAARSAVEEVQASNLQAVQAQARTTGPDFESELGVAIVVADWPTRRQADEQ